MKKFLRKAGVTLTATYFVLSLFWTCVALSIQLFFVYLQVSGNQERQQDVITRISRKIDVGFNSNPENIWYESIEIKNN